MKKLTLIALLAGAALSFAGAALQPTKSVLVWDDDNPAGFVEKYNVYLVRPGTNVLVASTTTNRWPITLPAGQHEIAVTAVSTNTLESELSETKSFSIIIIPSNLRIEQ